MLGSAAAPPGTCFGAYEVVREIGAGGMGTVYEGRHRTLGKRVAIKTLHAPVASDAMVVARFVREGQAASRLQHPNVVDVYDVGIEQGQPYLVMELLRGETLRERLDREGRLSAARALAALLPIAGALDSAHREGIVHRDIKPENIFLSSPRAGPPIPKLLDFGIAKARQEGASLTSQSAVFGTPYYMSPEQTRGAKNVDARGDEYSLAAVLYECVTGRRPFEAEHVMALVYRIQVEPFPAASSVVPELPTALDAVFARAMAREAADRFPTVAAFAAALLPFADAATRSQWGASGEPDSMADSTVTDTDVMTAPYEEQAAPRDSSRAPVAPHAAPRPAAATPMVGSRPASAAMTPLAWADARATAGPKRNVSSVAIVGALVGLLAGAIFGALLLIRVATRTDAGASAPRVAPVQPAPAPTVEPSSFDAPTERLATPLPAATPIAVGAEPIAPTQSIDAGFAGADARVAFQLGVPSGSTTRRTRVHAPAPAGRDRNAPAIGSNRAPILR